MLELAAAADLGDAGLIASKEITARSSFRQFREIGRVSRAIVWAQGESWLTRTINAETVPGFVFGDGWPDVAWS